MNPQVDVFIPVYGVERFIEKCLTSVLSQTYDNMRVVLIDDASPDESIPIAKRVIEEHNPHNHMVEIVVCAQNKGIGAIRKMALSKIKGKYTLFLDSDDFWNNENVVSEWVAIAEEGNYEVVISDFVHEYPKTGNPIAIKTKEAPSGKRMACDMLEGKTEAFLCNKLFLNEVLLKYSHMVKEGRNFWEDIAVTVPLLYRAQRVGYYHKPTIHYVHHGKQYTSKINPSYIPGLYQILSDLKREFQGEENRELATAMAVFNMRLVNILSTLPYHYYKTLQLPLFKIKRDSLPKGLFYDLKYARHWLTVNPHTSCLAYSLRKAYGFIEKYFRKDYYRA